MASEFISLTRSIFCLTFTVLFLMRFLPSYENVSQHPSLKKVWTLLGIVLAYDCILWFFLIIKNSYVLGVSSDYPPIIFFFSRILNAAWPFYALLYTIFVEHLADAHWQWKKRHYLLASIAIGLAGYFMYVAGSCWGSGQESGELFALILVRLFVFTACLLSLLVLLRKFLTQPDLPSIVRSQTKIATVWVLGTGVIMQPLWLLKENLLEQPSFFGDVFIPVFSAVLIGGLYFSLYRLFKLRLFNATNYVTDYFWETSVLKPFCQATREVRDATSLPELGMIVKSFFGSAFGFSHDEVKLYIRPTHHELNLEAAKAVCTISFVEALCSETVAGELAAQIQRKRILIYADIEYEKLYDISSEAKDLFIFMGRINAEIFIPIYGRHALVGYVVVGRQLRRDRLVRDTEVSGMLAFVDHLSHVIDRLQRVDIKLLERHNLNLKYQTNQLFQETEHTYEGMRTIMKSQATESVGMVFLKQKQLFCASEDTRAMLGVPEGSSVVPDVYASQVRQLFDDFKKYQIERSVLLPDAKKNLLRFTVMRDTNKHGAVVLVTYPSLAESLKLPIMGLRTYDDWMYSIFLRTTASGKMIENFIPVNSGELLIFKIQFLRAIFSRRPLLLQGATDDVRRLAELYSQIATRTIFEKLTPEYAEHTNELASKLFGFPGQQQGLLEKLAASGMLLIEHVDRLSLKTQEALSEFFTTGAFCHVHSTRRLASEALVICSSKVDLKQLVEEGRFSKELYEQLAPNSLVVPSLANLVKNERIDLVKGITSQFISEGKELAQFVTLTPGEVEELVTELLPSSICDLREHIMLRLQSRRHKQGLTHAVVLDAGSNETDKVIAQARRLGKAGLKNEELFRKVMALVKSSSKAGEIFGVDRSTIVRYCRRYEIDLDAHRSSNVRETSSGISV